MNLSLRNRISLYYLLLSSSLILFIFVLIYVVVYFTVYNHLDGDLDQESLELQHSLVVLNDTFFVANHFEWGENEHRQIEVNPVFMQLNSITGMVLKRTTNLVNDSLHCKSDIKGKTYYNNSFSGSFIRQLQQPIVNPIGKTVGYIVMAIPLEESEYLLKNLSYVLSLAFLFITLILFFSTRLIAGKSISPIWDVIETTELITRENLMQRIAIPMHKDELHRLVITINELLNRLSDALNREKQFTSDASHELRTPLSVIKGTLEVLIRKPRLPEQYEEKIEFCLSEIVRMEHILEQLLLLARFDSGKYVPVIERADLPEIINKILNRFAMDITKKHIRIIQNIDRSGSLTTDISLLEIILTNILSNSIKYSGSNPEIKIAVLEKQESVQILIEDNGMGISVDQKAHIFHPFYRGVESRTEIPGVGLGLAIVKKLSDLLNAEINVESEVMSGTKFSVTFKKGNQF